MFEANRNSVNRVCDIAFDLNEPLEEPTIVAASLEATLAKPTATPQVQLQGTTKYPVVIHDSDGRQ
jgi:hypothetical protein